MSSEQRQRIAVGFYAVQMLLMFFFCSGQFLHMLQSGTENIIMAMFLCVELFVGFNLILAINAHRAAPSANTRRGIIIYSGWVLAWGANLGLAIYLDTPWDRKDAVCLGIVAIGAAVIILVARLNGLTIQDPIVRGYLSLAVKALPQLAQAYKIIVVGGAPGLGWVMVWVGHATILTRIGQLAFTHQEAKQERNRIGLLISEAGNELSWMVTTIAWLLF